MEIEIIGVVDAGDLERERLRLRVIEDCDIGYFMVVDGRCLESGEVSTQIRQPYWFPHRNLKSGDRILLYTKKSAGPRQRMDDDGKTTYCFYRQLESPMWNRGGNCVLVLGISEWISYRYGKTNDSGEGPAVF